VGFDAQRWNALLSAAASPGASLAQGDFNVGHRAASVHDPVQGTVIPTRWLYPTTARARAERMGPYELAVALDAPMQERPAALVVISHGSGGSSLTHRDLALDLARHGFVVALLEHPGNHRGDNSLYRTAANLENRPRHIRLVVNAAFGDEVVGPQLLREQFGVIGHSMGGYTGLAIAGGRPRTGSYEHEGPGQSVHTSADPRLRALVLLAPACGWFYAEGALAEVQVPILLFTAEQDEFAPDLHVELVARGVQDPARIDHRVVANAGHHAFQSPFPPSMTRADFAPSQDPSGFDRAAFQPPLHRQIRTFLRGALSLPPTLRDSGRV
jgi:predicted dienelactone hydrolase